MGKVGEGPQRPVPCYKGLQLGWQGKQCYLWAEHPKVEPLTPKWWGGEGGVSTGLRFHLG